VAELEPDSSELATPQRNDSAKVDPQPEEGVSLAATPPEESPGAPSEESDSVASSASASPLTAALNPTRTAIRRSSHRTVFSALGAVFLLLVTLSGSVFAAHGLASDASVAPDAPVRLLQNSAQLGYSQSTAKSTPAPCNCSSKHNSYAAPPFTPSGAGQVVVISLNKQQLWAFQNGQLVMTSLVTTGMPQLPTPRGTFHIMMKESNVWFYSPWPYGSPFYYSPEHINYAMLFRAGGFYIHDAPWRETFGPGTNVPHIEPDGKHATGSHGCVNMPTSTAYLLYRWIGIGATVIIEN
jgi:hypothetical protein